MRVTRHKRQILLFLIAIVVPASVLMILAGRIMVQDRELATKRASDQRLAAVSQLRRELAASLEAIKLQEINRQIRSPNQPQESSNSAVIFTAALDGDRLVLPWEVAPPPDSAEFAGDRQEGEVQEFAKKDNAAAAASYRLALAAARSLWKAPRPAWPWRALSPLPEAPKRRPAFTKACSTMLPGRGMIKASGTAFMPPPAF